MGGVNLIRNPGAANVFRVASVALPGIATVTGCVDSSKLDVRQGTGTSGATVVYQGGEPKAFKVELHLMTEEDYDEWLTGEGRKILLTPPVGTNAKSFVVDHPSCQECGINSAIKQSIGMAELQSDLTYKVMIELMPTQPPKPSSGTPKGSQFTQNGANAADAADSTINDLVKQIKGLT
jgi:hypothetical protein